jgi:hypothetical protein
MSPALQIIANMLQFAAILTHLPQFVAKLPQILQQRKIAVPQIIANLLQFAAICRNSSQFTAICRNLLLNR